MIETCQGMIEILDNTLTILKINHIKALIKTL